MWQTLPGPSSSQDKSNSIACKNTSQAGKVRMAICWFLKHTLIQLQLQKKQSTAKRRWWNKWDKNECTDVERQEIRKTTKYQAEGGSERRGGGAFIHTAHSGHVFHSHQFGLASFGENPSGTGKMEVSGNPASHVEPVYGSFGCRTIFSVQQHKLLLRTHCTSFQHTLQLQRKQHRYFRTFHEL